MVGLMSREAVLLLGGIDFSSVSPSSGVGSSARLIMAFPFAQLFLAIWLTSLMATAVMDSGSLTDWRFELPNGGYRGPLPALCSKFSLSSVPKLL